MEYPVKKYVVFEIVTYYPSGGLHDVTGSFNSLEEAVASIKPTSYGYYEIVDRDTWKEIEFEAPSKEPTKE